MGQRRAARAKSTTRSSTSRYNEESAPKPTESHEIALYNGKVPATTQLTTKTLSNKRAKKLARNQKYIEKRLHGDLDMQVDGENKLVKTKSKTKEATQTEIIRNALWEAVNNKTLLKTPVSETGTTVGVQSF